MTALYTLWTNINDRRKKNEVLGPGGEVQLSKAQYDKILGEAKQAGTTERIAIERWWKEQFDAAKEQNKEILAELELEKKYRRRLVRYIRSHQPWDELAVAKLKEHDIDMPPPPKLDTDDLNGDGDDE